jgi:SAM-dependent methyltransferase
LEFAVMALGAGYGRRCLVIGSPVFEVEELSRCGWDVTYLDIRVPPFKVPELIQGNVLAMPFKAELFDAVSSTCVVCHAGLGRYGDPIMEDGDYKAMREIARVMKHKSVAVIQFGPCFPGLESPLTIGRHHRIYSLQECENLSAGAGLTPVLRALWADRWLSVPEIEARVVSDSKAEKELEYCYLSMKLEKE